MTQQLSDENYLPEVETNESEDTEDVVIWNPEQSLSCTNCGGPMKRMAPGPTTGKAVSADFSYSCRNKHCGPYGGSSGRGRLRVVVDENGEVTAEDGNYVKISPESEFTLHPEAGLVHNENFDKDQWEPANEE